MRASLRTARVAPVATVVVALALRIASARAAAAAVAVGVLALVAVGVGLVVNGRHHARTWRRAWQLLGAGLVVHAAASALRAIAGDAAASPSSVDVVALAGDALAAAGLLVLLRERLPGRAVDAVFEGVLVAAMATFIPWSAGVAAGVTAGDLLVLAQPAAQILVLWLLVRLVALSNDHPVAYRYVGAGFVCLLTVRAVVAGGVLGASSVTPSDVAALELWGLCLWGAGALHPSLRRRFDPVAARTPQLHAREIMALLVVALFPAAVFAVQAGRGYPPSLGTALLGATGMPLLVATYLVRQVHARATAEYRAQHDPLTGLPNSVVFHDRVHVALGAARRAGRRSAVMFLDLDRFKSINDSLGHAVGDELLKAVAVRLQGALRDSDSVARMGGDEFTILLSSIDDETDCARVAEKLLAVFADPIVAGGRELTTSTSIGVAVFPDDGEDAETLLKHADTAMYRAKANGRNAYQLYTSDMSARARVRLSLESNLRTAIERKELQLHYQPKVDLESREVVGLEALVRWPHRSLGFVGPDAFIPLAEETGLIVPLGEWVLEAACRQAKAWVDSGLPAVPVAVNLSARQFVHDGFEHMVEGVLARTGLDPSLLELEITESVFLHDIAAASATLRRLRTLGVGCSIDDFGTGYSGLTYLATMPIDALKIDRSFIRSISGEADESPIVEAVIALAHSLRMTVVAEGVETDRQARFLRAHGCEQMQGFLFSPPLPAHEVEHLLLVRSADDPVMAGAPAASAVAARGVMAPRPEVSRLLRAAAENEELLDVDERLVADVLAALAAGEALVAPPSPLRSASVRLAAGTFAGLMPIGGGLAAAGALPMPAHRVAAAVFEQVGVDVPVPPALSGGGAGGPAGPVVAPVEVSSQAAPDAAPVVAPVVATVPERAGGPDVHVTAPPAAPVTDGSERGRSEASPQDGAPDAPPTTGGHGAPGSAAPPASADAATAATPANAATPAPPATTPANAATPAPPATTPATPVTPAAPATRTNPDAADRAAPATPATPFVPATPAAPAKGNGPARP